MDQSSWYPNIIGDFNNLLNEAEKRGKSDHPPCLYHGFRSVLSDYSLQDLLLEGHSYTWARSKGAPWAIEEWLDTALVSTSWMSMFSEARLRNQVAAVSDHTPLELNTGGRRRRRPFRFENKWLREPDLDKIVLESWELICCACKVIDFSISFIDRSSKYIQSD